MADREVLLVDSHCHLGELERRGLPAPQVLQGARDAGVRTVVTSADNLIESRAGRDLAEAFPEVYFTVGWHPVNRQPPGPAELDEMRRLLAHPKAVALGEVGLDYFFREGYQETPAGLQQEIFLGMLELAAELALPVVIHQRQAEADLLRVLDAAPAVSGILHCFSGGVTLAAEAAARGLYCSFAGNVTFKSARGLQEAAKLVPSELLLVETDAPFLAPEPHRGQVCVPAMVRATAQWLAVLRGECLESIAEATSRNADQALGLAQA
ncbi:MAG: TatD family hydrolase [Candidatus Dormibacteria bacterium]